jgi:hypothetical protein
LDLEADLAGELAHDFDGQPEYGGCPGDELAGVAAVGPQQPDGWGSS